MANELAAVQMGQRMSSREIAELTEKRHDHVLRDIRKLIDEGAIGAPNFGGSEYLSSQGKLMPEYLLDFDATMTLLTGYNAVLRARVIKRWRELEQKETLPIERAKTPSIASEFDALRRIAITAGLEGNAATISADNAMRRMYGVSPLQMLQIELKTENQEQIFTPTKIGEILGFEGRKGARKVNKLLTYLDFQERVGDSWAVTEEGKPYAVILDTGKKHNSGAMVQQIKWKESVIPKLEKLLDDDDD